MQWKFASTDNAVWLDFSNTSTVVYYNSF